MKQCRGLGIFHVAMMLGMAMVPSGRGDILNFDIPQPLVISEAGTGEVWANSASAPSMASVNSVSLTLSHTWLGDLIVKLIPPSGVPEFVLFSQVGTPPFLSPAILGARGDVPDEQGQLPLVPQRYDFGPTGADLAAAAAAAESSLTFFVPNTSIFAADSWPAGPFGSGTWQLEVLDGGSGSEGVLTAVQMSYTPGQGPASVNWSTPSDIVYGTSLGGAQLNAFAVADGGSPIVGTYSYSPPAGTVLEVGAHTLSVTFTPQDTSLGVRTATVSLNVTPAPLLIAANNQTKTYGSPNPILTASYNGFVNGDTPDSLSQPVTLSTPASPASPVGTYAITTSGGASDNYSITRVDGSLTVGKATLTVTANDKSKVYGSLLPALTAAYDGFVNGDTVFTISAPTLSTTATAASAAGLYPITVSGGASANYQFNLVAGTLTVTKAPLTVTAADQGKAYGAAVPALTATYTGFVNGDGPGVLTFPVELATIVNEATPAGAYPITVTGGDSLNYALTLNNGTLTVTKATLTVTADDKTKVYGAALPAFTASYSGFVNGDTEAALTQAVSFSTTANAGSAVGNYPIALSGGASPNYTLSPRNGTLRITKATVTATADDKSKVYGALVPLLTVTYSGFVNGDSASAILVPVSVSTLAGPTSPVGTYPISVTGGTSANYAIETVPGTLTVTQAILNVVAADKSKVYGAPLPLLTATYTGFVNGDTAAVLTTPVALGTAATAASPVGSYPITASGGTSANYTLNLVSGTLAITKAVLTATADDKTKSYGTPLPVFTVTYAGFVNGDGAAAVTEPVGFSTTANAGSAVGTYPITLSGGGSANYTLTLRNGSLRITKATLTVTADDKSKVYGAALPLLTATYSGFVNGESVAALSQPAILTTTATVASPVGTYPITLTGGSSANYTLTLNSGVLSVTKAPLTVTAEAKSKVYGAAMPPLTATYSGFVNGDSVARLTPPVTFSTTATAASPVGVYAIIPGGGASANYTLTFNEGSLTITKAPLQITADAKTKVYGAPLPGLTATYTGFVNGDTPAAIAPAVNLSTSANASSPVGSYPIVVSGGGSANYTLNPNNGTLTVTKATLTVTADGKTKIYGAPVPVLTVNYTGFVNGDSAASLSQPVSLTTIGTQASPVGTYPIRVTGGASQNYSLVPVDGNLVVTKAGLTVTPDDKAKVYGAALPVFTATFTGFVNGDNAARLTQPVSFITTATTTSPVGTYAINAMGGASPNYTLVMQTGSLTVTAATLTVTAADQIKVYGEALPNFTATFAGFVNGDTAASLTAPLSFATTGTPSSPVGSYPIVVSGGASRNYALTYKSGTLLVARAVLTVMADNQEKVYGAPLPVFTATYSGFVNGDDASSLTQPVTFLTTGTASSPVGVYQIRATGGASPNYTLSLNNATLTITKAPLTIRADDKSKAAGAPLPVLTATYTGLVNGDTSALLSPPIRLSTAATAGSPVGSYPITPVGSQYSNYQVTYLPGTLTVTPPFTAPEFEPGDYQVGSDGSLHVNLAVPVGSRVRLESSDDLKVWREVTTQTSTTGELNFSVGNVKVVPRGFFRAVLLSN